MTQEEKSAIVECLLPDVARIASDAFGNFVVQKLFDVGTIDQRRALTQALEGRIFGLCKDPHGCRVIQKALLLTPKDTQSMIACELRKNVWECIVSKHGNHVIQKCVELMPQDSVGFIVEVAQARTEEMAKHVYGCRVIQRLLEHCTCHQLQHILHRIGEILRPLCVDGFGNFVVQHVLEYGRLEDKQKILRAVTDNILEFARNKCSSNVVERCFVIMTAGEHASSLEEERKELTQTILGQNALGVVPLQQMMADRFGNYVVQRMLEHSKNEERTLLLQCLQAAEPHLRESKSSGRHILKVLSRQCGTGCP